MLRNMQPAPEFTLKDQNGEEQSLSGLRGGRAFVLLFLRFAACPTTRRDLLTYGDVAGRLRAMGAEIAAVTADSVEAHHALHRELQLPFPVLSDTDFAVSELYGVYRSDETDEGPQPHGEPAVFILDVDGKVAASALCTAPKGLANPSEMTLLVYYMSQNGGKYW
jgi:peroxiredoxin Q/BCP